MVAYGLKDVLDILPEVRYAFAYGSAVTRQPGLYSKKDTKPLVDFMLAVDSPEQWHQQNIARNRRHYSCLAAFGTQAAMQVLANAEKLGAGVHFNTAIPWGSQAIKYGVIGTEHLCRDLCDWDTCYVSGRLHKPVQQLKSDFKVQQACQQNLRSALSASLLLLPASFSLQELFATIVGLSYQGDIRMAFAEDSRKVQRIVEGSFQGLQHMYLPLLQGLQGLTASKTGPLSQFYQDARPAWQQHLLLALPANLLNRMAAIQGRSTTSCALAALDRQHLTEQLLASGKHQQLIRSSIASIVRSSSRCMTSRDHDT